MSEQNYLNLLYRVLTTGEHREDRTGTGTIGLFGEQLRFDLSEGFPLLTTKRVYWKGVVAEMLWMLSGSTDPKVLQEQGVHIWDPWVTKDGNLGPIYGKQWRNFGGYDQILAVERSLKQDPFSRRHVVSAWNPPELQAMALPPCPTLFQFHVGRDGLNCHVYQRSADLFLGVPFDIAGYALLAHLMAVVINRPVGDLVFSYGDLHIYANHVKQVGTQLRRIPRIAPELDVVSLSSVVDYRPGDIYLTGYEPHPAIPGEVAI